MSELLIDDYPIAFSPKLAKELGIKEAIVFEYIKFRISQDNKCRGGDNSISNCVAVHDKCHKLIHEKHGNDYYDPRRG